MSPANGGRPGQKVAHAICAHPLAILLAIAAGLGWHDPVRAAVVEPSGYWQGATDAPVPATLRGGTVIDARALQALLKKESATLVDVSGLLHRPPELASGNPWIPPPHRGVPHALWIPGAGAGVVPQDLDDFYKSRLQRAMGGNLDAPLVIYCHEACWLSWNAAKRAVGYGYRRVYWFAGGVEGWVAAGQPTAVLAPLQPREMPTSSAAPLPTLAVLDMELTGDLGGPEFVSEHDARLKTETARLRQGLERVGIYRVLDNGPASATIDRLKAQQAYLHDCNGCDLDIGRQLRADFVLVTWVNRVSGLILTLTYEIHDVKTDQIAARKSYDFRGDSDNAWNHAVDYMVRDLAMSAKTDTD